MDCQENVSSKSRRGASGRAVKTKHVYVSIAFPIVCFVPHKSTMEESSQTAHISSTRSLIGLKFQTNNATWIRIIKKFHTLFVCRHWNCCFSLRWEYLRRYRCSRHTQLLRHTNQVGNDFSTAIIGLETVNDQTKPFWLSFPLLSLRPYEMSILWAVFERT